MSRALIAILLLFPVSSFAQPAKPAPTSRPAASPEDVVREDFKMHLDAWATKYFAGMTGHVAGWSSTITKGNATWDAVTQSWTGSFSAIVDIIDVNTQQKFYFIQHLELKSDGPTWTLSSAARADSSGRVSNWGPSSAEFRDWTIRVKQMFDPKAMAKK